MEKNLPKKRNSYANIVEKSTGLDKLREDYLDLFGDSNLSKKELINKYKGYKHMECALEDLIDYMSLNGDTNLLETDILIFETYIDLMLNIVKPRVKKYDTELNTKEELK